ncbi:Inorganic diphosphatase [Desulfotomaculum nigrificans CO-1-SRB]|uniref:inorganic diphosphatase n=1 Tax=Desulfotomaculum nigrificans (strain DSM 14880 / VKM B-2319 / CO-1-SRB) TaxID=868595 RepID=F6B2M1_DESCC|nr:putative manganese-dependent inorganic diphosphatase [Desulfotomaculum nigrificans]AEF93850.1 Inorganic diphosphatase [Desulfotomaculum nigrificans CO-1-SRB]
MTTLVFGHRNPDTDSVAAAVALSYLKNNLGFKTLPCILGNINKESQYVLDYFGLPVPQIIHNVKSQVRDLDYDVVTGIRPDSSILSAYKLMEQDNLRTLPIVDEEQRLLGIVTMKDIAMELVKGDFYKLKTSISNIVKDLDGKLLVGEDFTVEGRISVIAYYYKTVQDSLGQDDIIIVGDRYDIIECAIRSRVKLIILTSGRDLPPKYIDLAKLQKVPIISVSLDTYTTAKLINQCNYVSFIMKSKGIVKFNHNQYLDEIKEVMISTNFRNYPVVAEDNTFLGFINKQHVLSPGKKKVILVDHNEYGQSAEGLNEAEIVEIIDHHKLGDISTAVPISFRNMPVGSTCTIIHQMFKELNIDLSKEIAGILLAGIISDTLFFKSPTTTQMDRQAVDELNLVLNLNLDNFAMQMFKVGTSLEGNSIEEIFYKDFKQFDLEGYKVGIGQVFTLDIEDVFNRKEQFIEFVHKTHENKGYFLTLLVITDILKEGSYLIFRCENNSFISVAFNVEPTQGIFVPGIVSRKKQVVPQILDAINIIK